jgi:hypothetical protein
MTVNLPTNWKMHVGVVVLCASILSVSRPILAADHDPGAPSSAQVDQPIESLLRLVEQKIVTDHTSSPAGDSAVDAWKQVIHVIPATDPVRVGNALTTFAIHMRRRAAEAQKAGNTTVAEDMSVFASQAEGLKAHSLAPGTATVTAPQPADEPPKVEPLAAAVPPKVEPLAAAVPPRVGPQTAAVPPKVGSQSAAVSPKVEPPTAAVPPKFEPLAAAMPPITPPPLQPPANRSAAEFYAWRGDLMLARKDVAAARKYYEQAASAGSARAAMQLARLNDSGLVAQSNAEPEEAPAPPHRHRRRIRLREEPIGIGRIY